MLHELEKEEKRGQALVLARGEQQRRVRVPRVNVQDHPFCEGRQYTDLVEQIQLNKNPALHKRHILSRFKTTPLFEELYREDRPLNWNEVDEDSVSCVKGPNVDKRYLIKQLSESPATRPIAGQSVMNKSYYLIDPETNEPMVDQNRVYRRPVIKKVPPSFGHRPRSASRHLDPLSMTVLHHRTPAPERRTVGMSPDDLRELLHNDATLLSEVKPPSPKDHVMDVDYDLYTLDPPAESEVYVKPSPEKSLSNLVDTISAEFHAGGPIVDKKKKRKEKRTQVRKQHFVEMERGWDNRIDILYVNRHKNVKRTLSNEPLRAQLDRFRKAAAGIHGNPFCDDKNHTDQILQEPKNKYLTESGGIPPELEAHRNRLASKKALTPRTMRENREIQRVFKAQKARARRNHAKVVAHTTQEEWERIPKLKPTLEV